MAAHHHHQQQQQRQQKQQQQQQQQQYQINGASLLSQARAKNSKEKNYTIYGHWYSPRASLI